MVCRWIYASYLVPVAKTSIGDVIFNGGDFHFVFPHIVILIESKMKKNYLTSS